MNPFSFLYSQCSQVVCYRGPVKAASTGLKPGGTLLNGWAVRKPVLWWRPRLHVGSDRIMLVPVNTTANGRLSCQWSSWEGGSVERTTTLRMLGEYGLHLQLKDGQFCAFQVLIKRFVEKHTRSIAFSKKYPRSPSLFSHFNSLHIILPSLACLFRDIPVGAGEVTGDSCWRKRM